MRKRIICMLLCVLLAVVAAGCGCRHEWQDATCTTPKTCTECEETEGEALGHDWTPATCTEAETCTVCGETQGKALGHTLSEATCTEAAVCTVCGAEEGEPLGHNMAEATCTEASVCTVCGLEEGEPLGHTTRDWWEIVEAAPIGGTGVHAKLCDTCEEVMESEEYTLTPAVLIDDYELELGVWYFMSEDLMLTVEHIAGESGAYGVFADGESFGPMISFTKNGEEASDDEPFDQIIMMQSVSEGDGSIVVFANCVSFMMSYIDPTLGDEEVCYEEFSQIFSEMGVSADGKSLENEKELNGNIYKVSLMPVGGNVSLVTCGIRAA